VTTEAGGYVGRSITRREDARLLTGAGLFVADMHLPGEVHLAVLRSPHAHAVIREIDASGARAGEGVLAALTFADLGADPVRLPMLVPHKNLRPRMPYPLADHKVRHVGEPVAVVAAESRYQAEDALEHVQVEYEVLEAVTSGEGALDAGAPLPPEAKWVSLPKVRDYLVSSLWLKLIAR
jgi:aerobic carbon-monoxide dehydrogenase large subunit